MEAGSVGERVSGKAAAGAGKVGGRVAVTLIT